MSVTIFRDINFSGPFSRLNKGTYSGRDIVGCKFQSFQCEDLEKAINSIRVDANVIVNLYDSQSRTSGKSRVLMGPVDYADLSVINMENRITVITIDYYNPLSLQTPHPTTRTIIYDNYDFMGVRNELVQGKYDSFRLKSEEVRIYTIRSIKIPANTIAVLYEGDNFSMMENSVMINGPKNISDLNRIGMLDSVKSISIISNNTNHLNMVVAGSMRPRIKKEITYVHNTIKHSPPISIKLIIIIFILFCIQSAIIYKIASKNGVLRYNKK